MNLILKLIYTVPAVLIAICFHEFAHGFVSYKLGDPSPRRSGRLSLNPLHHLDPVGTLALIFFGFGWAKPVMVDPRYYEDKKSGMVKVALAGPLMNFFIAFICLLLYMFQYKVDFYMPDYISTLLVVTAQINIGLGVFNLIPFPPLDGSKVLGAILPEDKYFSYMRYEMYGQFIIILLLYLGVFDGPLSYLLNKTISGMINVVSLILGI